jgi:hypothetical protein
MKTLSFIILIGLVLVFPLSSEVVAHRLWTVSVNNLPTVTDSGEPWDQLTPPDVYFVIYDELGNDVYVSPTISDVSRDRFPLTWKIRTVIDLRPGALYSFAFFDEDLTKSERIDETEKYLLEPISFEFEIQIATKKYNTVTITGEQRGPQME